MMKINREFIEKEIDGLWAEDEDKKFFLVMLVSIVVFVALGVVLSVIEPPVYESRFFERLDETVRGDLIVVEEKKEEEKKEEEVPDDKGKKELRDQDKVATAAQSRGGGDPRTRVTSKGVLGVVSGTIKGAAIADADPFGKGGFAANIDAIIMGSGGLKRGGASGIGRQGVAGIGFGTGYGSGFGGGAGGVGGLLGGSAARASGVQMERRGTIKAQAPSSITGDAEGGGRSKEEIRRVVLSRIGGLRYIYNKHLAANPTLKGNITVRMTIAPSGAVINVVVVSSDMNLPTLEEEMIRAIRRWRFPAIPKGTVTVVYPFNFSQ